MSKQFLKLCRVVAVVAPALLAVIYPTLAMRGGLVSTGSGGGLTPQFPNLLNGYSVRPPAGTVAGVDFGVGLISAPTKTPGVTSPPAGMACVSGTHTCTITSNNVAVTGWDFSVNNGWQVAVTGATGVTIENSNFQVGTNNLIPIFVDSSSTATIQDDTIDGGSAIGSSVSDTVDVHSVGASQSTLVSTIRRVYFKNNPADGVDYVGVNGTVIFTNNLYTNGIHSSGAHQDLTQYTGPNSVSPFNTHNTQIITFFSGNIGSASQVMDVEAQPGSTPAAVSNGEFAFNVNITTGGNTSTPAASQIWLISNAGVGYTNDNNSFHDNYSDATSTFGGTSSSSCGCYTVSIDPPTVMASWNNLDLITGSAISNNNSIPVSPPATPVITTATPSGSTVALVGTGPNSTQILIFIDGSNVYAGKATTNGSGAWSFTTGTLAAGLHSFIVRSNSSIFNSSAASNTKTATI